MSYRNGQGASKSCGLHVTTVFFTCSIYGIGRQPGCLFWWRKPDWNLAKTYMRKCFRFSIIPNVCLVQNQQHLSERSASATEEPGGGSITLLLYSSWSKGLRWSTTSQGNVSEVVREGIWTRICIRVWTRIWTRVRFRVWTLHIIVAQIKGGKVLTWFFFV